MILCIFSLYMLHLIIFKKDLRNIIVNCNVGSILKTNSYKRYMNIDYILEFAPDIRNLNIQVLNNVRKLFVIVLGMIPVLRF